MPLSRSAGLRTIADNLDLIAIEADLSGHPKRADKLRNNAAFLRKTAALENHLENAMGKFEKKIHAVEKERDDAKQQLIAAQTALNQAGEAKTQLDALTAAGKVADDADVAALTDDPENATTVAGGTGTDTTVGAGGTDTTAGGAETPPVTPVAPVTPAA